MKLTASPNITTIFCAARSLKKAAKVLSLMSLSSLMSLFEGTEKLRILLTNDDGVYAPGLRAMRAELKKLGEVIVVAPATEQSAVGHSITLLTPLLVQEVLDDDKKFVGWAVEGRPADCVKLA